MEGRLRVTVQYLLTGLLGLIVSQIFGCLISWGWPYFDNDSVCKLQAYLSIWEPLFLVALALNFLRLGHGLVILELNDSFKKFISPRKFLGHWQLFTLACFVVFGILILKNHGDGLETNWLTKLTPANLSLWLFGLLALWDIPTGICYFFSWGFDEPPPSAQSSNMFGALKDWFIHFRTQLQSARKGDIVFRAVTNWIIYDFICILAALVVGFFVKSEHGSLVTSSVLLIAVFILDYLPVPVWQRVSNGKLYFS